LHDHGGCHRLGIRGSPEVGIGTRRVRDAELGRSVPEDEIALRSLQKNHGTWQQEFLGRPFDGCLKRDRVDRL
jgi:hypothetical protein